MTPATIATVYVAAPGPIVRVTVPLADPIALHPERSPFTLVSPRGVELQTQAESVALDVDGRKSRIVEVLALADGEPAGFYTLLHKPQRDGSAKLTDWARAQISTPPAFDGLLYAPFQPAAFASGYHRRGDVAITRRFYSEHFVGWLTAFAGCDFVEFLVKFHNAEPGSGPLFFGSLRLIGSDADGVEFLVPEPNAIGRTLIPSRADGKSHYLRQRQTREFRFLVHRGAADVKALEYARGGGFGVADTWSTVGAWGPTLQRLPKLPAPMLSNARAWLRAEKARLASGIQSGSAVDVGLSLANGAIGCGYTTGSNHGGVTGGGGRELFDSYGVLTALSGEPHGWLFLQAKCAAVAYRTPALINATGRVCELEEWANPDGTPKGGWQISAADGQFERRGSDVGYYDGAFGFYAMRAVHPQTSYDAAEYAAMGAIAPVDFQHYVRAYSAAGSLAMLANDPMAKHSLYGLAEAHRMSMRTGNRLQIEAAHVLQNPGRLTAWGRAHGHGYDCQALAYYLAPRNWRARRASDLSAFASTVVTGQAPNGCVQSTAGHKGQTGAPFNGQHRVQKATEATFLAHAAAGCLRQLEGRSSSLADSLLRRCAVDGFATYHAGATQASPHDWVAVQPPTRTADAYESAPVANWWDRTEIPIVYGMALEAYARANDAPPAVLLQAVTRYCGGSPNPRQWLLSQTLHKLDIADTVPLLAALE